MRRVFLSAYLENRSAGSVKNCICGNQKDFRCSQKPALETNPVVLWSAFVNNGIKLGWKSSCRVLWKKERASMNLSQRRHVVQCQRMQTWQKLSKLGLKSPSSLRLPAFLRDQYSNWKANRLSSLLRANLFRDWGNTIWFSNTPFLFTTFSRSSLQLALHIVIPIELQVQCCTLRGIHPGLSSTDAI